MKVSRERWSKEFRDWFRDIIFNSGVYEYRYPIKGVGVWPPYGMKIRRYVLNILKGLLEEKGHEEVLFPTLIPEEFLRKESEHIRSFEEEIFWVTRGGKEALTQRLALRPTSETAIMPVLKLWIKSHTDLPLKIYQVVNIFRSETKATHPLIRLREVTTFKEAHTAHTTFEEAEKQVREAIEIYAKFFDELGIPYIISKRPEWDKFAGAVYTIAFDTLLPDGRVLQIGTVHNLGQNFSKAFEVTYLKPDGKHEYVYTTSYGISERVIAALVGIHGDDHGLVLPPKVAPVQSIIIPIYYTEEERGRACEEARGIAAELKGKGLRVKVDDRKDITPGEKFYFWEMKGVPLRIEIGPKDLKEGKVTLVRRDSLERWRVRREEVYEEVIKSLNEISKGLRERAWSWFKERIVRVGGLEEADSAIREGKIVEVPWCGREECGFRIEEQLTCKVLGVDINEEENAEGACVICRKDARHYVRIAKTY